MEKEQKQSNILEQNQIKDNLKKTVKEIVLQEVTEQLKSGLFTSRKLTDTPSDSLQVVNRKYVTLNGATASRPTASVIGQHYFDTSLASGRGMPVYWNGTGFVDAAGNYV